jgi:hypothetical protein
MFHVRRIESRHIMTDSVSAIVPVSQKPMVHLQNPEAGSDTFLSRAAEATLSKLSQMQAEFTRVSEASAPRANALSSANAPGSGSGIGVGQGEAVDLAKSMGEVARSIHATSAVQQQLAQFVVASSVSSSFGRNLNMFLRGQ